jgi:hypothetical protein
MRKQSVDGLFFIFTYLCEKEKKRKKRKRKRKTIRPAKSCAQPPLQKIKNKKNKK